MCGYDYTRSCKLMLFWETRLYQPQTRKGQGMRIYFVHHMLVTIEQSRWDYLAFPFVTMSTTTCALVFSFSLPQHKYFYFAILRYLRVAFVIPVKPEQYLCTFVLTPDVNFTNSLRSTQLKGGLYEMRRQEIMVVFILDICWLLTMIPVRHVSRNWPLVLDLIKNSSS